MSASNVLLVPPKSPVLAPLAPTSPPRHLIMPTMPPLPTALLSPSPEGFLERLRKRTPSFPKSSKHHGAHSHLVAHEPRGPLSPTSVVYSWSASSTGHLPSPPKTTIIGKLAAAFSASATPRVVSPPLPVGEERNSTSTIRPGPHLTSNGRDRDADSRRDSPPHEVTSTSPPDPFDEGDLRPSGEETLFSYAEDMLASSRPHWLSPSVPPSYGPPSGPLPPLPTGAISTPGSPRPDSASYCPLSSDDPLDLGSMSRGQLEKHLADAKMEIETLKAAHATEVKIHARDILLMRHTIDKQQLEIDRLRSAGTDNIETRSTA